MNFSKVKLVMIVCLIFANIFIGILCRGLYSERTYVSEEESELAVRHLATLGIVTDLDREDRKKYTLPVYECEAVEDGTAVPLLYKTASETFFGRTITESEYVDIPGGFSVSIKNNEGAAVGTSSYTGNLRFECSLEDYSDNSVADILENSFYVGRYTYSENKQARVLADKFIKSAFGKRVLDIRCLGQTEYDGGYVFFYGTFLSDVPVADTYVNLFVKDGKIARLCARLTDRVPEKAYASDTVDPVDALYTLSRLYGKSDFDADGNDCITVTDIGIMYKMTKNSSGGYYFIPAWRITYSDGGASPQVALFDAIVGENSYSIG